MFIPSGDAPDEKVRVDASAYRVHMFFKYLVREWIRHPARRSLTFETTGLNDSGLIILQTIEDKGPLSISGLARELSLDPSTVNRQVRPLRDRNFLEPPQGTIGRTTRLSLTQDGRDVLAKMEVGWVSHWERVIKRLPPAKRKALADLVEEFGEAMLKDAQEHPHEAPGEA